MAAQEAPSFTSKYTYDVFLSFRGADICQKFIEVLHSAFVAAGLHPFIDGTKSGQDNVSLAQKAIQKSRICILVLSVNYASSEWCLDELLSILQRTERRIVLPVFFHVVPADVERIRMEFADAIAKVGFQEDDIKVNGWKKALEESTELAGFPAPDILDFKLIKKIVTEGQEIVSRQKEEEDYLRLPGGQLSNSFQIQTHPPSPEFNATEEKRKTKASSSAQEAPSFTSKYTYDVFLSFRGLDTRDTFAKDLYEALVAGGLLPFSDEDIIPGEDIFPELLKAIQGSRIWILVLSEKYASSTWCLDELLSILQLRELTSWGTVFPVFYHVDPRHVRRVQRRFAEDIAALANRFRGDDTKVNGWKEALQQSANLAGFVIDPLRISDSKFMVEIVEAAQKLISDQKKRQNYCRLLGVQLSTLSLIQTHPPNTEFNATEEKEKAEASSPASKYEHDLFLSFVEDTGNDVIDKLYEALVAANFRTFRDKNDKKSDSGVTSAMEESIKNSRISIVVFSANYAFYPGCLDKLLKILELRKMKKHAILPIFYYVTPSEVAKQEGSFGIALAGYDQHFKENQVNRWRAALAVAGRVKGLDFPNKKYRSETQFMEKIVQSVPMMKAWAWPNALTEATS